MKKRILFFLGILIIFSSCRPEDIDIDVPAQEPKLVVFSHVIPNSAMLVSLTKSFSALEPQNETAIEDLLVVDAKVYVTYQGNQVELFELGSGLYGSLETPTTAGIEYELLAIKDNDTITAKSTMLEQQNFDLVLPMVAEESTDTTIALQVEFTDNPAEQNWYLINVYKKATLLNNAIDGVNFFNNGSNFLLETITINDTEFSEKYSQTVFLEDVNSTDSIAITLSNISEEYYNYIDVRQNSGNIFTSLNLEPISFPTNINNGFGFFNTHSPSIRFFDLGEF